MGYLSLVGIKCGKNAFEKFQKAYTEVDFKPDEIYEDEFGDILIVWDWTKWYEEFEEIRAIDDVMRELDSVDIIGSCGWENSYAFMRIGEEFGDIETRSNDPSIWIEYEIKIDTRGMKRKESWGSEAPDRSMFGQR